ncbi:MAG: hypothetical protein JST75_15855 [Bacteroidetes bacterium]|nr:hypothetical protein [Bacteroidota bacterium]
MEEQNTGEALKNIALAKSEPDQKKMEIVSKRDWKEYVGESLLIIFSVVLALILTELVNKANENKQIKELIRNVRDELVHNSSDVKKQYDYHQTVLQKIDSALSHPDFAKQIITNNEFHLELIVDHGILYGNIEDVAWQLARSRNIYSHLGIQTLSLLTAIYDDQYKITKVEDEIGKIILNPDSRKPENIRLTLLLIRDNFRGWATYRVPELLNRYQKAIAILGADDRE